MQRSHALAAALAAALATGPALADVQVTEWMYSPVGSGGEYIEFTNVGTTPVDFSGWSFDDDSRLPGTVDLSAFGIVAPGESVILTEISASDFRSTWGLGAGVKVIGGNTTNLGRNDEINLYMPGGVLADRFAYGDQNFPGTIRTQGSSGNPVDLAALAGTSVGTGWVLAVTGDAYGSRLSTTGDVGNPGSFALLSPVPEPGAAALLLAGLAVVGARARRGRHGAAQ